VQYVPMIYLSTVITAYPTREFQHLLWELARPSLPRPGELVLLSASLLEEDSFIGSFVNGHQG